MSSAVASGMARIGAHMLWERVARMRPTHLPDIPPSFDAMTEDWLTAALCGEHPGAKVLKFSCAGGSSGSTVRCFISLDYNEIGKKAQLPRRVFAKASPSFTSRMIGLAGVFETEVEFFKSIRPHLDIEAPVAYFGGIHRASMRSIILLKERADCCFLDPKQYVTHVEAEDMVGLLAGLHSTFWNHLRFVADLSWLKSSLQLQQHMNKLIGFEGCYKAGIDRARHVIPATLLQRRDELWPSTLRALELNIQGDQTLLHHDVHIGNWYRTAQGRMGLTDWQALARGNWASDFAYAVSCALTVDDRRAWERDLLRLYLDRLKEYGVPTVPRFDTAWTLYRQQLFHGFVFWAATIGRSALQPRMQPDEFSLINIRRFTTALADHDSLAAVRK